MANVSKADVSNADVTTLSFERAIEELETIVKRLEDGKVPLEESVAIYERGEISIQQPAVKVASAAVPGKPPTTPSSAPEARADVVAAAAEAAAR